jgi:hypothetical protein
MSSMPEQTYLARTVDDDRYAWARSRPVHRRAVTGEVALLAVLAACTVAAAGTDDGWSLWFVAVWSIGLLAFIPVHSLLNTGIRGVFDRSADSLDEHQKTLRDRSFLAMARAAMTMQFAAWGGAVAVVSVSGHVPLALCWGFLLWFAAGLLPFWHLAWTAPDEPADDDS